MKIAFIVEFPTQFEVPFYQYVTRLIKEKKLKSKDSTQSGIVNFGQRGETKDTLLIDNYDFDFHIIYNNTDQKDYHDSELGKKVGWGFNLYEGYTYFIADKDNILNSVSNILDCEKYDYVILNGYKNSYAGIPELCKQRQITISLRIDSVLYNLSPIKKLLKKIYLPFAYRRFNHFFAVGTETKKFLNWLEISDLRISYFPYSVDEEWFRINANDTLKVDALKKSFKIKNEIVLLSVAKFVPRESPWDILKAFELLNDTNLVLILVGDGEDRADLENYTKRMPHLKIIFTGYAPYQDLPYYYGMATIFIHAAKNEPWGVSVHEALSCGCTVITSDKVGSSKDLILEGKNGFTYKFGNGKMLSELISQSFNLDLKDKIDVNFAVLKEYSYKNIMINFLNINNSYKINE